MYPKDVFLMTTADPFQPFRVHLADGGSVDVQDDTHRLLSAQQLILGLDPDDDGMPTRTTYIDVTHITRLETLKKTGGTNAGRNGG